MRNYQRQAIQLAGEILKDLNKPVYRICPGCGKPTDEPFGNDGDKYGHVYHARCWENKKGRRNGNEKV